MESTLAIRTLAIRTLENTEMTTLGDELLPLKAAFPILIKAIQIALTICVSTAQHSVKDLSLH